MMLIEEAPMDDGALPVDAFKAHLRLGTGFGEDTVQDAVLQSFLRAAIVAIEGRTGKILLERSFRWSTAFWRAMDAQTLPVAPVQALTSLEIVARDGGRSTVENEAYWLEQDAACPRLRAVGYALPTIPTGGKAELLFLAGYSATWSALPADLQQAVMLLAAHYYEFRDETTLSDGCMPFGVASLIERYTQMRLYGGGSR